MYSFDNFAKFPCNLRKGRPFSNPAVSHYFWFLLSNHDLKMNRSNKIVLDTSCAVMCKWNEVRLYSRGHMLTDDFQFMKQKCYFLRGVAECRHAVTPLSSYSIITTLQGFQKRYITLLYLKGLKRYQQKCKWKVRFTKESGVKCWHLNFESW